MLLIIACKFILFVFFGLFRLFLSEYVACAPPSVSNQPLLPRQDGKLTKEEFLENYNRFVGSAVTNFGELMDQHDEF